MFNFLLLFQFGLTNKVVHKGCRN